MVKAAKKQAAARARAGKAAKNKNLRARAPSPENLAHLHKVPFYDLESDGSEPEIDCGYEGGVNFDCSDYDCSSEGEDSDDEWSEHEELIELTEEDLPPIKIPDIFFTTKTRSEWIDAESSRRLGYTGLSKRTKERRDKEARDRERLRQNAKVS